MPRRQVLGLLITLVVSSCAASGDSGESRVAQCERLRDHLVDLRIGNAKVDAEAHRAALRDALGDRFVDSCSSSVTAEQLQCALRADSAAKAVDCTKTAEN